MRRIKASSLSATASPLACSFLPMVCLVLIFCLCEPSLEDSVGHQMSKFLVTSICLSSCLPLGFWHCHTGSKRNVFSSWSLTVCSHGIMEYETGALLWCLCGTTFCCEPNTLASVLPCLSPGCFCC